MFMNDVHKREEIRNIAIQDLKSFGIKYRCKKNRQHVQEVKNRRVFKTPLCQLPTQTVTLPSGQQLLVPCIVHDMCSHIIGKIDTEGLFRKGGSKSRQNEIRTLLDCGHFLSNEHEIDVASMLKAFFRELPEPLIPYSYHDLFLHCMLLTPPQTEPVMLTCLLLPTEHLNTLAYFMQFLYRVTEYSAFNKMNALNLAIVIGPSLMPPEEKLQHVATQRLAKTCDLFKMLIENAASIGVLSENILERIALSSSNGSLSADEEALSLKKKKKRRSGSLTRMLSGLKKMVSSKTEDSGTAVATPDFLRTPCVTRSAKKRKLESVGLSAKKKQNIIEKLPQCTLLSTPFSSASTPVNGHPNGKKKLTPEQQKLAAKEKRLLWSNRSKPNKKQTTDTTSAASSIQRRWSAVSNVAAFRRKKARNSCIAAGEAPVPQIDNRLNDLSEELTKQKNDEPGKSRDYVRIPKAEYEDIKNRVSAIERRISIELDNVENDGIADNAVESVSKAYEQTLVQTQPLSPTTDQLAKRLSRELKIRRSSDSTVIRSPSARKIGTIRKSREIKLNRQQSWCVTSLTPKTAIRQTRHSFKLSDTQTIAKVAMKARSPNVCEQSDTTVTPKRASSQSTASSVCSWKSARGYFDSSESSVSTEASRASLAKLRSQNAGMVLAKAKLFDNLVDSGSKTSGQQTARPSRPTKIGTARCLDSRQSYRVRTLRLEDRRKKNMSPRHRNYKSPANRGQQRMHSSKQTNNEARTDKPALTAMDLNSLSPKTPKSFPQIKRSLNPKSARRLCRTPVSAIETRNTPLKATLALNRKR